MMMYYYFLIRFESGREFFSMKKMLAILFSLMLLCGCAVITVSAMDTAQKQNAIPLSATGTAVNGTVTEGGTSVWYQLTTSSEEAFYYFEIYNASGNENIHLQVYNEMDVLLITVGSGTSAGKTACGSLKLAPNATYYVEVLMARQGTGNYSVSVSKKADTVKDEQSLASPVPMDQMTYGSIDGAGDVDWYSFTTGNTESYYTLYLKNESGTENAHLVLFSEREAQLMDLGNSTGAGRDISNNIKLEPNAKYYFKVYLNHAGTGNYSFKISSTEDKVGDTKDKAATFDMGQYFASSTDGAGDVDWYTFTTGSKESYYIFYFKNESGTDNAHLVLYNERDTQLLDLGNYASAGQERTANVKLEPNAKYYFKFYLNYSGTGNYGFRVSSVEDKIGDTKEKAATFEMGEYFASSIDGAGDEDWYTFTTDDKNSYYVFYFKNESGTDNAHLVVYNESGTQLLDLGNYAGAGQERTANVKLEPNAKYYFKFYLNGSGTGNYGFRVGSVEDKVGNTKQDATEIHFEEYISSSIDGAGDVDWYVLHMGTSDRNCHITYKNVSGTENGHILVYSHRDEQLIDVGNYTGAGQTATGEVTLKAEGTYYFKVYLNGEGTGEYSFELTQCGGGHTPSESWQITVEPDCFKNGEKVKRCTVCGAIVESEVLPPAEHQLDNWKTVKAPSLISPGKQEAACAKCGAVEYQSDWSMIWILPTAGGVALIALIVILSCVKKRRRW